MQIITDLAALSETVQSKTFQGGAISIGKFDGKRYGSTTHIGTNATFGSSPLNIEVFVHDYEGNLYGKRIEVDFLTFLRESVRFNTAEALVRQMREDISRSRRVSDAAT